MVSFALFRSKSIIRYCAKTKESAAEIIGPTFQEIFETMPPEIRPEKRRGSFEFFFRNHSRIVVFGTDAQSFDRGRGPGTGLLVFDEYAFFQDLPSIESALIPTLITTGGRTLYLSSPPRKPGHPAVQRIRTAEKDGRLTTDTFWNNPRINHEEVIAFECSRLGVSREGLLASAYFRREYLAEILEDEGEFFNAEWFKFLDAPPEGVRWVRSWDTAATAAGDGFDPDWTVGVKIGVQIMPDKTRRVIIADVNRFRKNPGETEAAMRAQCELDGPDVAVVTEQEPGSAGKLVVHHNKTRTFFGREVHAIRRTGDKASYWRALATIASAGGVYLVRGNWCDDFVRELCGLPIGHDDAADAAALGYYWLASKNQTDINRDVAKPSIVSGLRAIGI
jgi:predicted phage terminase large subunit-like protein